MRIFRQSILRIVLIAILLLGETAVGQEKEFTEKVFPNGVRLVYKQLPKGQTVTARIIVPAGFLDEPQEYLEISHLVEHLVFRGNGHAALSDSPDLMDGKGNTYNAFTTLNRTELRFSSGLTCCIRGYAQGSTRCGIGTRTAHARCGIGARTVWDRRTHGVGSAQKKRGRTRRCDPALIEP